MKIEQEVQQEVEIELTFDEQITAWKTQFGKVYRTTISGVDFYWRKLKRKEYVTIMSNLEAFKEPESEEEKTAERAKLYDRQELIAKIVILYPTENIEDTIENNAGVATYIADECMALSGFDASKSQEV